MPTYRSKTSTAGRNMAGARALWRATGMKDEDFNEEIKYSPSEDAVIKGNLSIEVKLSDL